MAGTKESKETDRQTRQTDRETDRPTDQLTRAGRPLNKSLHLSSIAAATGYLGTWSNILNISYFLFWFVTHNSKVTRQKQRNEHTTLSQQKMLPV